MEFYLSFSGESRSLFNTCNQFICRVLHEHIRKLARLITPSHNALRIPEEYLSEAPWPFAQQQISFISAYKTAREKVICVVRYAAGVIKI